MRAAASGIATRATHSAALVGALSARRNGVSAIAATLVNRQSSCRTVGKPSVRKLRRPRLAQLAQPRRRRRAARLQEAAVLGEIRLVTLSNRDISITTSPRLRATP